MGVTVTAEPPPVSQAFVADVLAREDYQTIGEMIDSRAKVLDLGCGEGQLMAWLEQMKGCHTRGVEISPSRVRQALSNGLSVYQGDIDQGLADYPDQAFDYVVLSQTLQETRDPREVLLEMVRVGKRAIVAFPNFGHWSSRLSLLLTGRAPKTRHLPYEWYNTPNIHVVTIPDFEELVRKEGLIIERSYFLRKDRRVKLRPSLMADSAVYLLRKG
ncbi:MAG: methionine biosynthesis protein MetW [Acidobacteria bacterium]|nr:methionine biosynthesis protein MetW [Acidobacteriota bacterium]